MSHQIMDLVTFGETGLIRVIRTTAYPERNSLTVINASATLPGSDAAIVAIVSASWGAYCAFVGNDIGKDPEGLELITWFRKANVITNIKPRKNQTTPLTFIVEDEGGGKSVLVYPSGILKSLINSDLSLISNTSLVYVDAYPHMISSSILVTSRCDLNTQTVLANLGMFIQNQEASNSDKMNIDSNSYKDALLILVRTSSWIQVSMDGHPRETAIQYGRSLLNKGASGCFLTLGDRGAIALTQSGDEFEVLAPSTSVLGTTGAGAVFSAGILYGFSKGWTLPKVLKFGVACGSLHCSFQKGILNMPFDTVFEKVQSLLLNDD